MTGKVKIVTDSSAYLEPEVIRRYDIRVVPLKVAFGAEVYTEGVDITNEEFYWKLTKASIFPTTSQPSAGDFIQVYSELARQGHPILSIHISSKVSGTISSALAAKNMLPQAQIEIVDSPTLAMGMTIVPAAEAAQRKQALPQITAATEKLSHRINVVGAFNTLEYLWRGGRIGAARALVGTLLRIKPVLTFADGDIQVIAKPRTMPRTIEYMLRFVGKRVKGRTSLHGWITYTHVLKIARALEKALRTHFDWTELRLFELGPVLATHMGPGFIGLGFYSDEDG